MVLQEATEMLEVTLHLVLQLHLLPTVVVAEEVGQLPQQTVVAEEVEEQEP